MRVTSAVRVAVLLVTVAGLEARARADLLELYAQAHAGGMLGGSRLSNTATDPDFFHQQQGGVLGAEVGAEVLFTDIFIDHYQFANPPYGFGGSWTQFMLGWDTGWPLDPQQRYVMFIGFDVGFGVGTPTRVNPPLTNDQVSWKGFVGELRGGVDYHFTKVLSMGVELLPASQYLFRNKVAANDTNNQLFGLHGTALLTVKADWVLK